MQRLDRLRNRGMALIASYFVLAFFLLYSNTVTMRTLNQQVATNQTRDKFQAEDLAQGAVEQFRDDFYIFFTSEVYQARWQGDAIKAMAWLDALGHGDPTDPPFDLTTRNVLDVVQGSGISSTAPRWIILPSGRQLNGQPARGEAWLVSIVRTNLNDSLSPRRMSIEGRAAIGSTVKRFRATYEISLKISDIFRYAYFVNNYGWFDIQGTNKLTVQGDVRSNGNLDLTSDSITNVAPQLKEIKNVTVNGDLFASKNVDLGATGTIGGSGLPKGNPSEAASWYKYWSNKDILARPALLPTNPDPAVPPILGGISSAPFGTGWDSLYGDQHRFENLPVQDMPYLGDLGIYKTWANQYKNNAGSSLNYLNPGPDGKYQTADDIYNSGSPPISKIYAGPNGMSGDADDAAPLVLVGTKNQPIVIDGPVIVPGDVIIVGYVTGRGTIYAGRNIHILGSITTIKPPTLPKILRWSGSGQIYEWSDTGTLDEDTEPGQLLGTVCNNGQYVAPTGPVPAGCI